MLVDILNEKKVIGAKQSTKELKNNNGKILYIAQDADIIVTNPVIALAKKQEIEVVYIETMRELGKFCGIDVGASVALLLKK